MTRNKLFALFAISVFCLGCSDQLLMPTPMNTKQVGGIGFAGGVAAERTKQAISESLTPNFPLHKTPIVVCSLFEPAISCIVVPCKWDEKEDQYKNECILEFDSLEAFAEFSPKVIPLAVSAFQITAIVKKCEKDKETKEACVEHLGHYEGQTFIITEKK